MSIKVNRTEMEWVENETVAELLRRMNYIFPMVVVKVDGSVVPKTGHSSHIVPDGSVVEVIHIESGG